MKENLRELLLRLIGLEIVLFSVLICRSFTKRWLVQHKDKIIGHPVRIEPSSLSII